MIIKTVLQSQTKKKAYFSFKIWDWRTDNPWISELRGTSKIILSNAIWHLNFLYKVLSFCLFFSSSAGEVHHLPPPSGAACLSSLWLWAKALPYHELRTSLCKLYWLPCLRREDRCQLWRNVILPIHFFNVFPKEMVGGKKRSLAWIILRAGGNTRSDLNT